MDFLVVIAVWAMLIVGSGLVGVLIGDWIGARRTHCLYAQLDATYREREDGIPTQETMVVEHWRLEGRVAPRALNPRNEAAGAEQRYRRRQAFAAMPPLETLREQADAIRELETAQEPSVWDDPRLGDKCSAHDPIGARVLDHYEVPSDRHRQVTGDQSVVDMDDGLVSITRCLPHIGIAAPLELSTRVDDLTLEWLVHT